LGMAQAIAGNAPLAIAASKRVIEESADWPVAETFPRQDAILEPVLSSADALEGAKAFAEKRAPTWSGR
jgi:enoyl-CoA hydratase